jgi:hypothetical protein
MAAEQETWVLPIFPWIEEEEDWRILDVAHGRKMNIKGIERGLQIVAG